jgi:hypothetical protein
MSLLSPWVDFGEALAPLAEASDLGGDAAGHERQGDPVAGHVRHDRTREAKNGSPAPGPSGPGLDLEVLVEGPRLRRRSASSRVKGAEPTRGVTAFRSA